jgi:RimJ/RimL family protein N-acetyltransferase
MIFATKEQAKEIYEIFRKRADVFPHIRYDYVQRAISGGRCVYQNGVVIIFSIYKKRTRVGTCGIPRNNCMLHQIVNGDQGNGNAKIVLEQFLAYISSLNLPAVWLSVRADNERATKFYEKNGFSKAGTVEWLNGTLAGLIYRYSNEQTIL